ncbi:hypothetical protein Trydic_g2119 [Trypoxylus dichotomus]
MPTPFPKITVPTYPQQNSYNRPQPSINNFYNRPQPPPNNFYNSPQFPQNNFNHRPQFQPFKPPTQITRNTQQITKPNLRKPTPMDWSSFSGISRNTVQQIRYPTPMNNQPQLKVEELFYQEDPYENEAVRLQVLFRRTYT